MCTSAKNCGIDQFPNFELFKKYLDRQSSGDVLHPLFGMTPIRASIIRGEMRARSNVEGRETEREEGTGA